MDAEQRADAIEEMLNRLEGWDKAYPLDIFSEPTAEERDWLHNAKPGLMDRIAASMGRHMAKCIREDVQKLRALAQPAPEGWRQATIAEAARLLQVWLDEGECDCDGPHTCGRHHVQRIVADLKALPAAPEPEGR